MKRDIKDKTYSIIIITVISLLLSTPFYLVMLQKGLSSQYTLLLLFLTTLFVFYVFVLNLEKTLLFGYRKRYISQELFNKLRGISKSSGLDRRRYLCDLIVVDDPSYIAFILSGQSKYTVVLSNTIISDFNTVELETVFDYLDELNKHTLLWRDSVILLLATWAQRLIITSLVGAALVQIVRNPHLSEILDERVINRKRNVIGYKALLEKFKSKAQVTSVLPSAVSMNGIVNVKSKNTSMFPTLYFTHPAIEKRILTVMKIHDQEKLV